VILLSGCNNENALDCFKTTGEIIQQEVNLTHFNSIEVLDEVDVYLIHSEDQKVVIKAGINLMPKIILEVKDGLLTISNNNKCNWTRSPENPGVYIYSNDISSIAIFDFSNFFSEDTVMLNDLKIYSDGTGNFDMILDVDSLYIESIYISNFKFSGIANYLSLNFTDDSQFYGGNLKSQYCEIYHKGSNRVEIYPVQSLTGALKSTGSLYYYNNPGILDITVSGSGELVDLSN
jgi:hypothetical protein